MLQRLLPDLPGRFLRNLEWQYVANLGAGGLGGLYMLLLGRVLGVSEFGVYSLCVSFATLIFNLFDMRLQEAAIRFVSHCKTDDPDESALTINLLILVDIVAKVAAFAVLMTLVGWAGRHLLKTPDKQLLLVLAGISLFVSKAGNAPAVGILRLMDKFDIHARLTVMDWGGRLVITALVAMITPLTVGLALSVLIIVGAAVNVAILLLARKSWLRRIVIGLTTRLYPDGRKREELLLRVARTMRLDAFRFDISAPGGERSFRCWKPLAPRCATSPAPPITKPTTEK